MICKIADLIIEVPVAGGMASRCWNYRWDDAAEPDITIHEGLYKPSLYASSFTEADIAYMESARQFCYRLLDHDGLHLHASAVCKDGKAYLFSADPGVGKSTHARMWKSAFGDAVEIINDDKPALRRLNGQWYAYGTPWCGKDGINMNRKVRLAGICFLKQAPYDRIVQLNQTEALPLILAQTFHRLRSAEKMDLLISHVEHLVKEIPIFMLENRPEEAAAFLSHEVMEQRAREYSI